ncbi:hypothetical protein GCM10023264_23060 [Sphingomonas daechungensis]|uniref:Lipoprotein n=1 Tax=Sphingomonas daechungensis TaxID=1176646 RepID=A0ABX6T1R4_9SPHN|nr:hypothetical protein [Sphingomonas daechungensis]QNP43640.1 hypothetical protein H9L15_02715 [Sphingomonas daechungensis]
MMMSLAAATLLNAAAVTTPVAPDQLPNLFIAACFEGKAAATSATQVGFDGLPTAIRSRLGKPSEAQVWKIAGSEDSYLYSLSYTDRSFSPRICGVASQNLVLRPASAAVESHLRGGQPSAGSFKPVEWLNDKEGYRALATRTGGYTVLQVNWNKDAKVTPTQ